MFNEQEAYQDYMDIANEADSLVDCQICGNAVDSLNDVEINIHKDDKLGNFYFEKIKPMKVCDECEMKMHDNVDYCYNEKGKLEVL